MKIILGTAHLSSTAGKRSPDGLFREYKYSREICKLVKEALVQRGYDCVIDYEDDDMLGLTSSQELVKRVKIVNDYCNKLGKQNCIYVSIHVNAAPGTGWSNATGWSVYTSEGQTKSDILATSLYESAKKFCKNKKFRTGFSDGDCDFEEHFYVLKHTYCPAVLTENFFQNCKADVEYLTSEEGKKAIVNLHVEGICNYLSKY